MQELTKYSAPASGTWEEQVEQMKLKFPDLNDEDFKFDEGHKEEMMEKLAVKLGKSREELAKIFVFLS